MPSKIRTLLNKIKWDPELKENEYLVTFIHRGIPSNRKIIESKQIRNVSQSFFSYEDNGNITHIPFHRIIEIKDKGTNKIIYLKK
ncbi:MAG: DUF504 domain-containing protein [Candidatus Hodarchaeota archaeon]